MRRLRETLSTVIVVSWSSHCLAAVSLGAPQLLTVDGSSLQVVAADVNHDALPDLLSFSDSGDGGATVSVLPNLGSIFGSANPRLVLDPGQYIGHAFAVADFDGDGRPDVAVAVTRLAAAAHSGVVVFRNNGTGGFRPPVEFALDGFFPACAETADLNGDGAADLLICQSTLTGGRGLITALLGPFFDASGAPVTPPVVDRIVGTSPSRAEIADLDGDGIRDAVVMDPDDGAVYLLYSEPQAGGLLETTQTLVKLDVPQAIQVIPVAGGLPGIAVADGVAPRLLNFPQPSPRHFASPASVPLAESALDFVSADLDGDGRTDIAVLDGTGLSILLGNGSGVWHPDATMALDFDGERLFAAVLAGNGQPDLMVTVPDDNLIAVVPVGAAVGPTPTPTMGPQLPGDADCNGVIEPADVEALVHAIFAGGCSGADANEDGLVTAADLPALLPLLFETTGAQPAAPIGFDRSR